MARDYYEILGVAKNASDAEIKKAYRRIAMKHHPDRNLDDSSAESKFKEARKAYEVLSDSEKRMAYDQFGHQGEHAAGMGGGASGFHGFNSSDIESVFGDIFGNFGGRQRSSAQSHRGEDLEYGIELTLEEAAKGKEQKIQVAVPQMCDTCHGTGAKPGVKPQTCGTCHGTGSLRSQQGFFSVQQTCPSCRGSGDVVTESCSKCHGAGQVTKPKKLAVNIPPGVDTGDRVRLSGEGAAGLNSGTAGDLYIRVKVKPHPIFKREEGNLLLDVPIAFTTAALGGTVKVPSLDGYLNLKVPAGTQSGKQFRIGNKGIPSARGHRIGDMICSVHIETPVNLTAEHKKMLAELDAALYAEGKKKHSPKAHNWVQGVKKFFTDFGVF